MPTFISASPNPVIVTIWSVSQQGLTTITWDTGNTFTGTVWVTDEAGTRPLVDRKGKPAVGVTGSAGAAVRLGKVTKFELKRTNNPAMILATVMVEGREQVGLPGGTVLDLGRQGPLFQGIYNLRVLPSIDWVRLVFRTRQPTVPFIDIKTADTQELAGAAFPFARGASQTHDFTFPLAQDTTFQFHILAPSALGFSQAKAAEESGLFKTGSRKAEVFFDQIFMHTDGDPGALGDGDFRFNMGAGNIETGEILGQASFADSISGGEFRSLDLRVPLPGALSEIFVQVRSNEDDSVQGHFFASRNLELAPEGSTWQFWDFGWGEMEISTVTKWFDLSEVGPTPQEIPFKLETGPKHVDYTIVGRLHVEATPGVLLKPQIARPRKPLVRTKNVAMMVAGEPVVVGGAESPALVLAQNGNLYRTSAPDDDARNTTRSMHAKAPHWALLASVPTDRAPVAPVALLVAMERDTLHLLSMNPQGALLHQSLSTVGAASSQQSGDWTSLGGTFVWPIAAVVARKNLELFALNAAGDVFHRTLTGRTSTVWEKIGKGMAGSLNAFTTPDGKIGLLAVDRKGKIQYLPWSSERSPSDLQKWNVLGVAPEGTLSVESFDGVVVFAALGKDETVVAAPWRNSPELPRKLEWQTLGTVNSLLTSRTSLLPGREVVSPDPAPGSTEYPSE